MKPAPSLLVLALALLAPSAYASTHPPVTFEEVLRRADVGFHGVVSATREVAPDDVAMAFTVVTFEVRALAFDRTESVTDTLELTFAGGRRGDRFVTVAGVPRFSVGDEVVLFVRHDGLRYADPVVGGPQGRFLVSRDDVTGRPYVLTAGRRGLVLGDGLQGGTPTEQRVERVADGRPVFAARPPSEAAPLPAASTAGASARPAAPDALVTAAPERIADLASFLARARAIAARG